MSSRNPMPEPSVPTGEIVPGLAGLPNERETWSEPGEPLPAKETLPTMYDLPDEEVGQPGMPDEFHLWQPRLLDETFRPAGYAEAERFTASDLNLYYDVRRTSLYVRPDWYAVVGIPAESPRELKRSYVIWQEGIVPFLVVELLSPGTEDNDLGLRSGDATGKPVKWEVYERMVRVPYYVTFSRYTNEMRVFRLVAVRYEELTDHQGRFWMPEVELGLGLWQGTYHGEDRLWLRFFDVDGRWIPTPLEKERSEKEEALEMAETERLEKEAALEKAEKLAAKLKELGIDPDTL